MAKGAVVDPAGVRLGARDEILDRTDAGGGIDYGPQRIGRGLRDRDEIAKRVVGELLIDEGVGRHRAYRRVDQRVTIGGPLPAPTPSHNPVPAGTRSDN